MGFYIVLGVELGVWRCLGILVTPLSMMLCSDGGDAIFKSSDCLTSSHGRFDCGTNVVLGSYISVFIAVVVVGTRCRPSATSCPIL